MLSNESIDVTKTGPGLFSIARIANLLGVSIDWLAGRENASREITQGERDFALAVERFAASSAGQFTHGVTPPTPQAMMRTYVRTGGMLEGFEHLLKYCDRYHCVSSGDDCLSVKAVGRKSLAGVTMGTNDASVLQLALNTAPNEGFRAKLIADHLEAQSRGCLCTVEELDIQMPNKPVRVKMDYIRTLLHVTDATGSSEVLSYCCLIA
ncbi:hypothetical protein [Pseudophaeobacter sp. C1-32P7]|uniref:hypothetical protein n=1 Tax=Pseudophaeobacter sp. C1-32P7 TaxID=3098142 RepID=UPI0034D4B22A